MNARDNVKENIKYPVACEQPDSNQQSATWKIQKLIC